MDNVNTTADKISRMYSEKYTEIQNIGRNLEDYENERASEINTVTINTNGFDTVYAYGTGESNSIDNADFNNAVIISLTGTETLKDTVIKNVTMNDFSAENDELHGFHVEDANITVYTDTELNNVIVTENLNVSDALHNSSLESPGITSSSINESVINNSTFSNVLIEKPAAEQFLNVGFDSAHVPELIANKGTVNELYVDTTKERVESSVGLMLNEETHRIITAFPTLDDIVFEENRDYMYTSNEGNLLYGNSSHLIEESDNLITASGAYNACINDYEIPEKVNDYFVPVYDDINNALTDYMNETVASIQDNINVVEDNLETNESRFNRRYQSDFSYKRWIDSDCDQNLNDINNQVNDNFNDTNSLIQNELNVEAEEYASASSLYTNAYALANSWAVPFNDSNPWNSRLALNTDFYYEWVYSDTIQYANLPVSTSGLTLISKNSDFGAIYVGFSNNGTNNIVTFYSRVNAATTVNGTVITPLRLYGTNCFNAFSNVFKIKSGYPLDLKGVQNAKSMFDNGYNLNQTFHLSSSITDAASMFNNCRALNVAITFDPAFNGNITNLFSHCNSLNKNIILPEMVTNFSSVFYYCESLNQNIKIPSGANIITGMFNGCLSLNQNIKIPSGVVGLSGTFRDCRNLNQNIYIPESVTGMAQAFNFCNKLRQNILVPSKVESLYWAFANCHLLQTVSIKSTSVTTLQNAFRNCQNLTSIYINHLIPKSNSNAIYNALINGYAYGNTRFPWTVYNTL